MRSRVPKRKAGLRESYRGFLEDWGKFRAMVETFEAEPIVRAWREAQARRLREKGRWR